MGHCPNAIPKVIRILLHQIIAVTVAFALLNPTSLMQINTSLAQGTQVGRATEVVKCYVGETRRWPEGDYRIEFKGRKDSNLVFWVIHKDDHSTGKVGGGGKSFAIELSDEDESIKGELYFQ